MKGTILDFLKLATEKPEIAKGLVELATKYDFEFTSDELSDADLDAVAGGVTDEVSAEMSLDPQRAMDSSAKYVQTLSNILKNISSTQDSIVQNIK